MKIKIEGKEYKVPAVSELSFQEFNKVIVESKVATLPEYLAAWTDIEVEQLMESELDAVSVPYIHQMIFDLNVKKEIQKKVQIFKHKARYYELSDLSFKTFGKSYFFDLYLQKYREDKINEYELSLYALAIAICDKMDHTVEELYQDLIKMNWREVLPHAFFLAKRCRKENPILIKLLKVSMLELRKTSSTTSFYLTRLRVSERTSLASF